MDPSPPPTHLPYDILALVVKESVNDPSTLSAWCRTSFSMLELATPLLYSKIQFNDRKAYSDLFSQPPTSSPNPTLSPFFDLARLRHLVLASPPSLSHPGSSLPHSRFNKLRHNPIPIENLELVVAKAICPNYPFRPQDILPQEQLSNFLTGLSPERLILRLEGTSSSTTYAGERSSRRLDVALAPIVGRWRSLKEIEVVGLVLTGKELLFVTTLLQVRPVESRRLQSYTISLLFTHPLPPFASPLWITETLRTRFEHELGETSGLKTIDGIRLMFNADIGRDKRVSSQEVQDTLAKIKGGTEEDGGHKVGIFLYWRGQGGVREWCRAEDYWGGGTAADASSLSLRKD